MVLHVLQHASTFAAIEHTWMNSRSQRVRSVPRYSSKHQAARSMSLGQKRTWTARPLISALPPIATGKVDIGEAI